MDLREAFARWARAGQRRELTAKRYGAAVDRLVRWWDLARVGDVTTERVREIQAEMLSLGYSPDYVRCEVTSLCAVLASLARDGLFSEDLVAGLRKGSPKPTREPRRRRVRHLSRTQVNELADAAARIEPYAELPIRVAALLGPRTGELCRMRAEDRRERAVDVVTLPEFGEYGTCKTGPRVVPVCAELETLLEERLPKKGWLFPARSRRSPRPFLSRDTIEDALQKIRRKAGLPDDITFMVLRHSRASWWVQAGVSLYKVADWLGHDFETCERYYGSLVDGYDEDCERMPAA